jgi:hypothetical protein
MFPGANKITKATRKEDLAGTDYWVHRASGLPPVSVDVKHRSFCPVKRFSSDDACVEIVSVYRCPKVPRTVEELKANRKFAIKPGWTVDKKKRTDFIAYTWPSEAGNRRFWVVSFPLLCTAARSTWTEWADRCRIRSATNFDYLTLSIYPQRSWIKLAMEHIAEGFSP